MTCHDSRCVMCPWLIDFSFHSFLLVSHHISNNRFDSRWWCQRLSVQSQYKGKFVRIDGPAPNFNELSMEIPDFGALFIKEPELKEKDGVGQDASDVMQVKGLSNVSWTSLATFWSSWFKAMEQGNDEQVASVTSLDEMFSDSSVVHFDDPRQPWLGLVQKWVRCLSNSFSRQHSSNSHSCFWY